VRVLVFINYVLATFSSFQFKILLASHLHSRRYRTIVARRVHS